MENEKDKELREQLRSESLKLLESYENLLPENSTKWHALQHIKDAFKWANMTIEHDVEVRPKGNGTTELHSVAEAEGVV